MHKIHKLKIKEENVTEMLKERLVTSANTANQQHIKP